MEYDAVLSKSWHYFKKMARSPQNSTSQPKSRNIKVIEKFEVFEPITQNSNKDFYEPQMYFINLSFLFFHDFVV